MAPTRRSGKGPVAVATAPVVVPTPAVAGTNTRITKAQITFACSECRKKKSKCSGERPSCAGCRKSRRVCVYAGNANETREGRLHRLLAQEQQRSREVFALLETAIAAFAHFQTLSGDEMATHAKSAKDFAEFVEKLGCAKTMLELAGAVKAEAKNV